MRSEGFFYITAIPEPRGRKTKGTGWISALELTNICIRDGN